MKFSFKSMLVVAAISLSSVVGVGTADAATERSVAQKHAFMRSTPCPVEHVKKYSCPGYVVDHVKALACGGADLPSNMQWQTIAEGKAKDKWERKGCQQ